MVVVTAADVFTADVVGHLSPLPPRCTGRLEQPSAYQLRHELAGAPRQGVGNPRHMDILVAYDNVV